MSQAFTVRPVRPGHFLLRRRLRLAAGAAIGLLLGASAATAQQYDSVGSSVIVDYGVLDSLGQPNPPNLPGMLGGGPPPASPYGGAYPPAPGAPYGGQGVLLQPPPAPPRSGLTAPGAAGSGTIKLIPPSEFKNRNRTAAVPPAKPTPPPPAEASPPKGISSPPPQPVEPAPPPPPTEIEAPAPPAPPTPPPGSAADAAPEPPAMAQVSPPAAIVPGEAETAESPPAAAAESVPAPPPQAPAAAEPAPPPPAPAAEAAGADTTAETDGSGAATAAAESDVDEVPPTPEAEAMAEIAAMVDQVAPEQAAPETAATEVAASEVSQAALPAPAPVEGQVRITFAEGASELTPESRRALDTVAERLREDESLRVQLLAYAKAIDDNTSRARRMSLSRALEVRSYLIEKGVRATRMDVRALGSSVEDEPVDRVDIIPQAQ